MKISNLEFKNNVFLAPMAGVTDIAFRGLCKSMGCGLIYTEMVSAKALHYGSSNTEKLLELSKEEVPVAVQIFGHEPVIMAEAAEKFSENDDVCIIDVNMGCPAPKIVKNGEGSALMKYPKLAAEIIREMKRATKKPVTAKFRKGFDEDHINAVEFAKILEDAGVDAIAVHGRTRAQMYEGKADWDIIAKVKSAVKIPVIGNGDVISPESAEELFKVSNCDGIMIGRGAMGNPWLFKQISNKFNNEKIYYPTNFEKIDVCIKHYNRALLYLGEDKAVREMRKHIGWYLKGMKNCTEIKDSINSEKDAKNVLKMLQEYKQELALN